MQKDDYRDFAQSYFDEDYFIGAIKSNYRGYHPSRWEREWKRKIELEYKDMFERRLPYMDIQVDRIKTVLVVGAAFGFEVKILRDMGFDAVGLDCSEYAVENAVVDGIIMHNVVDELPYEQGQFDLVLCPDVLEHVPEAFLIDAIRNIRRVMKRWLVVRLPLRAIKTDRDVTHFTVKPVRWWCDTFMENGFAVWKGWHTGTVAEITLIRDDSDER